MSTFPWQTVLSGLGLAIFLFFDAVLVACETFLVRLRHATVDQKALDQAKRNPGTARLLERSHRVARTIRWGGILTTLTAGFLLFPFIEGLLGGAAQADATPGGPLIFALGLGLAFGFHVIFGEMVPRGLAMANSMRTLRSTSFFLTLFEIILLPFFGLLEIVARKVLKVLGVAEAPEEYNLLDVEVLLRALTNQDEVGLSPQLRQIIRNTLRIRELEVSDVLLPRNQVQYMELADSVSENLEHARRTGHTRFPLCDGDLDRTIGLIHVKDVFRYHGDLATLDLRGIKRDITRVSQDLPLEQALRKLLALKMHMALVMDAFGGVAGVITLERILEELVGDIQDEFDAAEEQTEVVPAGDGAFHIRGLTPIHDVEEALNIEIENEEVSTFGGLITAEIGRIPQTGEEFALSETPLDVRIDEVDERRIIATTVRTRRDAAETDAE
ncbi:MAG: hemolysin family protein [Opitutales bacterium]